VTPKEKTGVVRVTTGEWIETFLSALRTLPVIRVACKEAGISRKTAYQWRERDPEFRAQWDEAHEDGIDMLEATLHKRAREKDTLASIFLLKAWRPERYREHATTAVQVNVVTKLERVVVQKPDKGSE
jgi:hypothetical protein